MVFTSGCPAGCLADGPIHALHRAPQPHQRDPAIPVISQRPIGGTVVTEPIVLDTTLQLPGANKWRDSQRRLDHTLGLDQEKSAFPKSEERFAAFGIGTATEHPGNAEGFLNVGPSVFSLGTEVGSTKIITRPKPRFVHQIISIS